MNNTKFWVSVWQNGVLFTGEVAMLSNIIASLQCMFKKIRQVHSISPRSIELQGNVSKSGHLQHGIPTTKCIHFCPFWLKGAVFNKYFWSIHAYVFAKDKFRRKNQISTVQNHIEFLRCTYFCFLQRSPQKNNCKSRCKSHVGFFRNFACAS
jgi:hypothetical protein